MRSLIGAIILCLGSSAAAETLRLDMSRDDVTASKLCKALVAVPDQRPARRHTMTCKRTAFLGRNVDATLTFYDDRIESYTYSIMLGATRKKAEPILKDVLVQLGKTHGTATLAMADGAVCEGGCEIEQPSRLFDMVDHVKGPLASLTGFRVKPSDPAATPIGGQFVRLANRRGYEIAISFHW